MALSVSDDSRGKYDVLSSTVLHRKFYNCYGIAKDCKVENGEWERNNKK